MADPNNVFISWSGSSSQSAAEILHEWLPNVIQSARPWMSAASIDKGARWNDEIAQALETMKAGIICLTPDNLTAEWLLFEAGALAKMRDAKSRVWTYLLGDLRTRDLRDPLKMFQATIFEKEDTRKLLHSINKNLDSPLTDARLNHSFDKYWPELEEKLKAIPKDTTAKPPKRKAEDLAAETLELLQALAPNIIDTALEIETMRNKRLAEESFWQQSLAGARTNPVTGTPGQMFGSIGSLMGPQGNYAAAMPAFKLPRHKPTEAPEDQETDPDDHNPTKP